MRMAAVTVLGIGLIAWSLATTYLDRPGKSKQTTTRVCSGADYSFRDGCERSQHVFVGPAAGQAYVVTQAADPSVGIDQYELVRQNADGSTSQVALREVNAATSRYVLVLGDIMASSGAKVGPGTYDLVTEANGHSLSYRLRI